MALEEWKSQVCTSETLCAVHVREGEAIEWLPIKHTPKYGHAFICMGDWGRVNGDWEGAWGLGGCMGTGRVHGDWEGALSCLLMDGFTMYEDGEEEGFVLRDLWRDWGGVW